MKKYVFISVLFALALFVYAADQVHISRLTTGIAAVNGPGSSSIQTLVTSDSATREYKLTTFKAAVVGAETAYTNTFGTAFTAAPLVWQALGTTNVDTSYVTASTTAVIITPLSTNASEGTNNLSFIVYGYTRTGSVD